MRKRAALSRAAGTGLRFNLRPRSGPNRSRGRAAADPSRPEALSIEIHGTASGYRALGEYFLALSRLESDGPREFHEEFKGLVSLDGSTQIDVVVRRLPALASPEPLRPPSSPKAAGPVRFAYAARKRLRHT